MLRGTTHVKVKHQENESPYRYINHFKRDLGYIDVYKLCHSCGHTSNLMPISTGFLLSQDSEVSLVRCGGYAYHAFKVIIVSYTVQKNY